MEREDQGVRKKPSEEETGLMRRSMQYRTEAKTKEKKVAERKKTRK